MLSRLYKLIFDLGVCCSLGAFLLYFFGGATLHVSGLLILLAAAVLSLLLREKGKQSILFVVILPILGWLFLRPAWVELIVYMPVWGYTVYLLVSDRLLVSRGEFLDRVRRILLLGLILPLFMLVELHTFGAAFRASLPYLVVTLVSIVFMLRYLRTLHRMEGQRGNYAQQLWEIIFFLVICVLLTIARAPQNLLVAVRLLYENIILPILSSIGLLIGIIFGGVISWFLSLLNFGSYKRESSSADDLYGRLKDIPELKEVTVSSNVWLLPLLYSIGVILGLGILFFFFRWLIGDRSKHKLPEGISEIREALEDSMERKNHHRWKYSKEPAERVRYYYMKYLLHLRSIKLSILPGDTTRAVDQKYSDQLADPSCEQRKASKQLKELYREARYQTQQEMTGEKGEQAKRLYQIIGSGVKRRTRIMK